MKIGKRIFVKIYFFVVNANHSAEPGRLKLNHEDIWASLQGDFS